MESLNQTYIQRDLPALGLPANPTTIRTLLTMLVSVHTAADLTTATWPGCYLSAVTIQHYLGFLENAYLIRRLPPYFINIGKRLVKASKILYS